MGSSEVLFPVLINSDEAIELVWAILNYHFEMLKLIRRRSGDRKRSMERAAHTLKLEGTSLSIFSSPAFRNVDVRLAQSGRGDGACAA